MSNTQSTTNMYTNLNISGNHAKLNVDELSIKDNIITLNAGETSNKISKNKSGLEIDRGTSSKYQIIYNEEDSKLKMGLENSLKNVATEDYVNNKVAEMKDGFFELDENGDFMPVEKPTFSASFELDENGDIMMKL